MGMHNPPHPGEFITGVYLEPNGVSGRELAAKLDVAASTLSRVLNGSSRLTPRWPCGYPRRSDGHQRAGSPCRMPTTCGSRVSKWT